ncbi:inner centromere protein-like [Sceloporus undulatus]|uniref:inner centromere protein-like n=1 Tax=Sceloporus undulatus TaxID=8520 RepID=UPI001C4CBB9D|nr:inner centromere protein-like [Sceloporus undulatus]
MLKQQERNPASLKSCAMAEARGPTHLLEVCNQKFAEFLYNAEYKCLMWLREIEEEALKMFESNFTTEPELMPKTPSQRKHRKKKRSSSFKDENKELTRKRLSKRRSGIKTASFQRPFQNKEGLGNFDMGIMDSISHCMTSSVKEASDVQCDISPEGRTLDTNCGKNTEIKGKEHERMTEKTEKEGDASRLRNTPSPKAFLKGKPSCRVEEIPAQGLINSLLPAGELSQEVKDSPGTPANSQSGHHPPNRVHKIRRVSLVEKYSLTNKRKSTIRKSLSRAMAKKKSAQDTSSTCSHASSHSSLEVFMDGETSQHRPLLTQNAESGETPNTLQKMPCSLDTPSPIASCVVQSSPKHDMQQEVCSKEKLETEIMDFQVSGSEDSAHNNCIHTQLQNSQKQSYKHKLDQPPVQSIQDEKFSSHKTASSPANKIIRPIKNFFQSMQKNNLLKPSGSPGKNSVKHSTPIRPATKGDFVEKQRQRLESLRKKQEAEQQRKQKVEEEKRRRLEEIKLKREERLKKALQARERVEQMEEEKKKRIGQKLSQLEEKNEKVREEKAAEEKNRKKKSVKKMGEAEARKQKLLQVEEEPKVQEQPEKWKTVGEIRKMLEHNKASWTGRKRETGETSGPGSSY